MAKNTTLKNQLVSTFNGFGASSDQFNETAEDDQQVREFLNQIKNIRIRPSLSGIHKILEYARTQTSTPHS